MTLTGDLDHILEWHIRHGSPAGKTILPGLSEAEILAKTSRLPFQLPEEYIELYRWRNGVPWNIPGDPSFFEYHRFLPLDEALDNFKTSYPIMKQFYKIADWIMVFQDPSGDGYGVSGGQEKAETSPVTFLFEGEGVKLVFDTLAQLVKTMAACFDERVFTWDQDQVQTDFDRLGQVAYRLNPNIRYWKEYARM